MNLLSSTVNFCISPLRDALSMRYAKSITETENQHVRENLDRITSQLGTALQPNLEEKIKRVILNLGYDASKVILRVDDNRTGVVMHSGSIKQWGACFLVFNSKTMKEMEKGITKEHEFVIAHELAHDDEEYESDFQTKKTQTSAKYRLIAYGVSVIATNYFFPGLGYIASHIGSIAISKLMGRAKENNMTKVLEKACDLRAVAKRPDLAQAGINYFQSIQHHHLQLKRANPKLTEIDQNGENTHDLTHPKLAVRIQYLTPLARAN